MVCLRLCNYFITLTTSKCSSTITVIIFRSVRRYVILFAALAFHPMILIIIFLCIVVVHMSKCGSNYIFAYSANFSNVFRGRSAGNMVHFAIRNFTSVIFTDMPMLIVICLPASGKIVSFCKSDYHITTLTCYCSCTVSVVIIWCMLCICWSSCSGTILTDNCCRAVTVIIVRHVICLWHGGYCSTFLTSYCRRAITVIIVRYMTYLCLSGYFCTYATCNCRCTISVIVNGGMRF